MPQRRPLARVFPGREFFRGHALVALLWSVLSAGLLCLTLFTLFLIADLLDSGGRVSVVGADVGALDAAVGSDLAGIPDRAPDGYRYGRGDGGLLHAVWSLRDTFFGPGLAWLYRAVPPLRSNLSALGVLTAAAVLLGLLRTLCRSLARLHSGLAANAAVTRLRRSLHRQALRLGPSDMTADGPAKVLALFTDAAETVRVAVQNTVLRLGRHPVKLVLLAALALLFAPLATLQCAIPLAACWALVLRERRTLERTRRLAQMRSDRELRLLAEGLSKARVVKGYGMEEFESARFNTHLERFQRDLAALRRRERLARGATRVVLLLCFALVGFLLAAKVLLPGGGLSFAGALLIAGVFYCATAPIAELLALRRDRADGQVAADRVYRYLNLTPEVGQAVGAKFLQPLTRALRFEGVSYTAADGRRLLDDVSLVLPAGQVLAVVSPDPASPRALAALLPRFIEPQRGTVRYDEEDVAWVTLESLRAETVIVGGDDPCFTGTIRENLTGGDESVAPSAVTEAAKIAHAHNFIQKFPNGYETVIGEHGESLNPGQLFRLGLARAVLRDPAVLVVEEPAAELDEDTKTQLDDTYNRVFPDRTVLVMPGRMATLRRADRILVLHRGRVEALGTRDELMRDSPLYRHWEYSRFNEFRHTAAVG